MNKMGKKPPWFKVKTPGSPVYLEVRKRIRLAGLHTVCEEAACPNIGECWDQRSATFMVMGDICTRACRYCAVTSGKPGALDLGEPARLADTIEKMGLQYCVITSVDRDDLPDGGAFIFSECIKQIHHRVATCGVEVLVPDFQGNWVFLDGILREHPIVLNHNIETVRRIFPNVRPKGDYYRSLDLFRYVEKSSPEIPTKSGIMVGLGETVAELNQTMTDLRSVGCTLLTIGQYLRPSPKHVAVDRFYHPKEFLELEQFGYSLGFKHVAAGPLVRSSYRASEQAAAAYGKSLL